MIDYKVWFRIPFTIYFIAYDLNARKIFLVNKIFKNGEYCWNEWR